ncbi:glucokinase [Sandarakinorhabdus sp. DWP1-3-1]|uniref:glucokinase n=1 Tax=Sandarakinorhabdus sp. DWP1-3-1 TaxID=2804627 RepID=UPI003CECA192
MSCSPPDRPAGPSRDAGAARDIVAVDIGGTHARFAIATIAGGRVVALSDDRRFRCADDRDFATSWRRYAASIGRVLPRVAAVAVAAPVGGDVIALSNNEWVLRRSELAGEPGIETLFVINDFAAVAHAVAQAPSADFRRICGPDVDLPATGVISVIGPGTGLGVAMLVRDNEGHRVFPSEGGHGSFAALDAEERALAMRLDDRYGRTSVERIVSGPGLRDIRAMLAETAQSADGIDDAALWQSAIAGTDPLSAAALDRFCRCLGTFAGDMALAHGAAGVVIAGSLANRLAGHPALAGLADRFVAKGRFSAAMAALPVRLLTLAEPGLFGAAAAFAAEAPASAR